MLGTPTQSATYPIGGATAAAVRQRDLALKAKLIYAGRRARERVFGGAGLFADPAWDILLDAFVADQAGARVSVSSAAVAASVAPTTALRWIDRLVQGELLRRRPDQHDRRRFFLELTERGRELMGQALTVS